MTGLAIASGVASLGSAIYGAVKSSQENKKALALLEKQREDNKKWYETKMNEDYTSRADAQALLTKQRELLDEHYKQAEATNIVTGGTGAALAAQKEAANRAMAQTTSDMASDSARMKDNVEQQYRASESAATQQGAQIKMNQGNAIATAAGQAVNAGLGVLGAEMKNETDLEIAKLKV